MEGLNPEELIYHLNNEINVTFTLDDAFLLDCDRMAAGEYNLVNFFRPRAKFLLQSQWLISREATFVGRADQCVRIRHLCIIINIIDPSYYRKIVTTNRMIILSVNVYFAYHNGSLKALARLEYMDPWAPVLGWLYNIYTTKIINRTKAHCRLEKCMIKFGICDSDKLLLGWGCFFGFNGKQSYSIAEEYGVPLELCRVNGENAAYRLNVPIGLMYKYIDSVRFLRSLRLVCKLWNTTIEKYVNFWNNVPYLSIMKERYDNGVKRKKQILRGRAPRLRQIQAAEKKIVDLKRMHSEEGDELEILEAELPVLRVRLGEIQRM